MEWIKARKKPIEVEVFEVTEEICEKLCKEKNNMGLQEVSNLDIIGFNDGLIIKTLEGEMKAHLGDYIIKGVKGELYPCRKDIFEETYYVIKKWQ